MEIGVSFYDSEAKAISVLSENLGFKYHQDTIIFAIKLLAQLENKELIIGKRNAYGDDSVSHYSRDKYIQEIKKIRSLLVSEVNDNGKIIKKIITDKN